MSQNTISNFAEIKAALIRRGSNLTRWARENGFAVTTVHQAASGARSGKLSIKIRERLEEVLK